jgi:tetratricopeptide (TPR) repeat protein
VGREITMAIFKRKKILPVLYRSCSIRADLEILQIISFLAPKKYEQALGEVLLTLGLPAVPPVEPREQGSSLGDPVASLMSHLQAAFAAHDWPDVIRKADYLVKHMPGGTSAQVYRLQGLAFLEEGEEQHAQEALEAALALVGDRELRLTLLSDYTALLAKQGQWVKVQKRAREALRLVPNDPGWLATQQQAQSELAKQAVAYNNKGVALDNLKRYEEAIAAYDQAIRLDPNNDVAYNNKGYALNELKRYKEALAAYEEAIRLDPNSAVAYNNKGNTLERLGKKREAQQAYARARQLGSTG